MPVKNILAKIGYTGDDLHFSIENKHFHMLLACMPVCLFERVILCYKSYTLLTFLWIVNLLLSNL